MISLSRLEKGHQYDKFSHNYRRWQMAELFFICVHFVSGENCFLELFADGMTTITLNYFVVYLIKDEIKIQFVIL